MKKIDFESQLGFLVQDHPNFIQAQNFNTSSTNADLSQINSFCPTLISYSFYTPSKLSIKLYQLECKLGIKRDVILKILEQEGYYIPNRNNYILTADELAVVIDYFSKSLKSEFKKIKKSIKSLDESSRKKHARFFRSFIKNNLQYEDRDIFKQNLDSELIKNWVYQFCNNHNIENYDSTCFAFLKRLKYKLRKNYSDCRTQIFSFLILHHYHVFPSEEKDLEKFKLVFSFSRYLSNCIRKAIIIFLNFITFHHGTKFEINKSYKTIQFIVKG